MSEDKVSSFMRRSVCNRLDIGVNASGLAHLKQTQLPEVLNQWTFSCHRRN